jgi:NTP pyrophosphatase (non-canonical NTP hydrolase)
MELWRDGTKTPVQVLDCYLGLMLSALYYEGVDLFKDDPLFLKGSKARLVSEGIIGISDEFSEVSQAIRNYTAGVGTKEDLIDESGDIFWYSMMIFRGLDISAETIWSRLSDTAQLSDEWSEGVRFEPQDLPAVIALTSICIPREDILRYGKKYLLKQREDLLEDFRDSVFKAARFSLLMTALMKSSDEHIYSAESALITMTDMTIEKVRKRGQLND